MVVVPSFPLFNLPLLAIKKVIISMVPVEQIYFSLISKKSKELVKRKHILDLEITTPLYGSSNRVVCKNQDGSIFLNVLVEHISLKRQYIDDVDDGSMFLNYMSRHQYRDLKLQKFDNVDALMKLMDGYILTLWENKVKGIEIVMSLLFNLFKIRKFSLNVQRMHKEKVFRIITQFQKLKLQFKANISKVEICATSLVDYMYRYILEKFNDVPELFVSTSDIFYQHSNVQPESYCEISDVKWSTLEMFNLPIKYKSIKLYRLNLTTQEVNQFLKKWMESSTMQNVEMTAERVDYQKAMEGLPATPQNKLLSICELTPEQTDCFEIHRKDGMKANLWNHYGDFAMQTYK